MRHPCDPLKVAYCCAWLCFAMALTAPAQAYEVWLGCTKIPRTAVTRPETWENARAGITGTNLNTQGFVKKNLTNPIVKGEENLTKRDWEQFFAALPTQARRGMKPIARSAITNKYAPDKPTIEQKLLSIFEGKEDAYGYEIGGLLPYSSRLHEDKQYDPVNFSTEELATIRNWLNTYKQGKYKDVKIIDNIGLFNKREFIQGLSTRGKFIDAYLFEAAPEKFYEDNGNRQDMLKTFLSDSRLSAKDLIFQIPISPWKHEHEKGATNYQMLRSFLVWLGENFGYEFLKSDRVKFLITTYSPTIPFYPELSADESEYQNTITGIVLSLIEQESLFTRADKNADGSPRIPTMADAHSYHRTIESGPLRYATVDNTSRERTWTDATGQFRTRAELVAFNNGQVTLRKSDGSVITLSINQLSQADRQYLDREK